MSSIHQTSVEPLGYDIVPPLGGSDGGSVTPWVAPLFASWSYMVAYGVNAAAMVYLNIRTPTGTPDDPGTMTTVLWSVGYNLVLMLLSARVMDAERSRLQRIVFMALAMAACVLIPSPPHSVGLLVITLVLLLVGLVSLVWSPPSRRTSVPMLDEHDVFRPIWGVAGSHVGANTGFGELAEVGATGERAVGEVLERFVEVVPHARVFHGLCFTPGRRGADVDHVVVLGEKVLLIDAKNWSYGSYRWVGDNQVNRNGAPFGGSKIHMSVAVGKWTTYLPSHSSVTCLIVLAKPETSYRGYTIDNSGSPHRVTLCGVSELERILMQHVGGGRGMVDRHLLHRVREQLQ